MVNIGNEKKRVRLKGIWIPKIIVYLSGMIDARKGRIKTDVKGYPESAYLCRKVKDYACYSSQIYNITKLMNKNSVDKIISCEKELESVKGTIDINNKDTKINKSGNMSKKQCRKIRRKEEELKNALERKNLLETELKILSEHISCSEHETEQILINARSRLESMVMVYLQGAGRYINISYTENELLHYSPESKDIYIKHCGITEYLKRRLISEEGEEIYEEI